MLVGIYFKKKIRYGSMEHRSYALKTNEISVTDDCDVNIYEVPEGELREFVHSYNSILKQQGPKIRLKGRRPHYHVE